MSLADEAIRMAGDPVTYFDHSARLAHHLPRPRIEAMQLAGLQQRFDSLRNRIAVLKAAADEQKIDEIASLADGGRLLFPHTVYKLSLIHI
ncbi:MAG: hypothetical protein N2423_08925, partial [Novosphingobium sp.]|nr:hypothetical protein [Novosphingobium sp.]